MPLFYNQDDPEGPCSEPDGNKLLILTEGAPPITQHEVMLDEDGQCPWCGDIA